jgi:Ca2+-binding RTX toxin-like protein
MATIKSTNSGETKTGTTSADLIYGYGGNDSLYGRAGNDQIWGGLGDDKMWGESGNDTLRGESGNDTLNGGAGNDAVYGGIGNDQVFGGLNNDKIWGEAGNDILRGEDGIDTIYAGDGNDLVYGGIGNDILYGDGGTDTIRGEAGNDILKGGSGLSYLLGGDGADTLYYDPSTSAINTIGSYLTDSVIDGGTGIDTAYLYNKTHTTGNPTELNLYIDDAGTGHILYEQADGAAQQAIDAGFVKGVEKIVAVGDGGFSFTNSLYAGGIQSVTGTAKADKFYDGFTNTTYNGGGGNDEFTVLGGFDKVISEKNDADRFYIEAETSGKTTITGFTSGSTSVGDKLYIDEVVQEAQITEYAGATTFHVSGGLDVVVDMVGMTSGVDYFFV